MVAKLLDHNNRELKQQRQRRQRERQKGNRLDKQNNNFVNAASFFVHFLAALLDCDMRLPNFTRQFYGVCEHNTNIFFFFFSTLIRSSRIQYLKISPTFGRYRSIKFETVRIHFLNDVFSLFSKKTSGYAPGLFRKVKGVSICMHVRTG